MDAYFPLFFAAIIGFGHAFEADHLVAVGNIVTKRKRIGLAIKDGIFWGLGHSSTIFLIGLLMIAVNVSIVESTFKYFEAAVGLMLVLLGCFRLIKYFRTRGKQDSEAVEYNHDRSHHLAYGVGLIHGLAGSGAIILLAMTDIPGKLNSLLYLLIFGVGSILGMLVAAGIFSLPFTKRINVNQNLQVILIVLSSFLCIGYGSYLIIQNIL